MDLTRWRCMPRKQVSQPKLLILKIVLSGAILTMQYAEAQTAIQDYSLFAYSLGEEKSISDTPVRPLPKDPPVTGSTVGCAPAPIPSTISLIDAVQHALCRNPQTRQTWALALGQAAGVGSARSAYLPTLTAGLSRSRDEPNFSPQATATSKNVALNYVLYDFGLRAANLEAAQQSLSAALSSQDAALQTVFTATTSAYYDAVTARSSLQAALDAERAAQESLNAAQAKVKQGAGTPTDVMQARSAYSKAVLDRVKTEGGMLSARGALAFVMGLEAQTPLLLSGNFQASCRLSVAFMLLF